MATTTVEHHKLAEFFMDKGFDRNAVWNYLKPRGYCVMTSQGQQRFDINVVLAFMDALRAGVLRRITAAQTPQAPVAEKPRTKTRSPRKTKAQQTAGGYQ